MPFFSPKTWKQRIVEFPGRRRLDDTSSADVYDVSRAEGTVTQEGDGFTAANMNDLEQRINNAVNDVAGLSADEYDPNATYSSGDLRIHDNILHKANQDISVPEPWTPDHWDPTTLAAEFSALNSSLKMTTQNLAEGVFVYYNDYMVTVRFYMTSKTYTADTWNTIAVIPEDLRPASVLTFTALNNNVSTDATNTPVWCRVTTDGNLQIYVFSDRASVAPVGVMSYVI